MSVLTLVDPFAAVVKVLRPVLGVDHRPAKVFNAREFRAETLVVAVVAGADVQKRAPDRDQRIRYLCDAPARSSAPHRCPKIRIRHTVIQPNEPLHVEGLSRVVDVAQER
jgi:hypothetical protein